MPRQPLAPPPGVVRNGTREATPGRWFDSNGIRFNGGQMQPTGGWVSIEVPAFAAPPRDAMSWHDNRGARWCAVGTTTALFAVNLDTLNVYKISGDVVVQPPGTPTGYGTGLYSASTYGTQRDPEDVTPGDVSTLPGDWWSLALFGEDLLFLDASNGNLFRWKPSTPTIAAVQVPNAPLHNRGLVVTDERHVVLVGAGGDPRAVAWSDQENPESWAPTLTNMAGSKQLVTESNALLAVRTASGVVILTNSDCHLMRYVGPPYAYGITAIGWGCGPIGPRAWVLAGDRLLWLGRQSVWQYAGTVTPVQCPVQDWLFTMMNRNYAGYVFGLPCPEFSEAWWYFPDEGATECNRYVLYNYREQSWAIGRQARSAGDRSGAMSRPVMMTVDGKMYWHEFGFLDDGATRVGQVYAESGALVLGEGDRRMHVQQIAVDATNPQTRVGYRFFMREQPQGPEFDSGAYQYIRTDGLIDLQKVSGRSIRMRVEAALDGPWAMGKTRLMVRPGGTR